MATKIKNAKKVKDFDTLDLSETLIVSDFTTALANDPSTHFLMLKTISLLPKAQDFRIIMPEQYLHLVQTPHTVQHTPKKFGKQYTNSVLVIKKEK